MPHGGDGVAIAGQARRKPAPAKGRIGPDHRRPEISAVLLRPWPEGAVQTRWKISVPRLVTTWPFGATSLAIHLVATVPGLTTRPYQTAVTAQSDVHVLEVWNL